MECKVVVKLKTVLDDKESKVLYKLLCGISDSMIQDCGMTPEENGLLSKMFKDMDNFIIVG